MRNGWLRVAAAEIGGGPWTQARQLRAAIIRFRGTAWPIWRKFTIPPAHATQLEAALFFAFQTGAESPVTVQMLRQIVGDGTK
jgi:hypothetical protein